MLTDGVHEMIHEPVFPSKWLNNLFLPAAAWLSWWNYPLFHASHKEHHRHTVNEPEDLEVTLP